MSTREQVAPRIGESRTQNSIDNQHPKMQHLSGVDEWKRYLSSAHNVPAATTSSRKRPPLFRKEMNKAFLLLCIYIVFAVMVGVSVERMRGRGMIEGMAGYLPGMSLALPSSSSRRLTDEITFVDDDVDSVDKQIEMMQQNQADRAIYLVSMGEKADDISLVQRCLISIRRKGNWRGYVVVLTNVKFQQMYQEKLGKIDTYLYGNDSHIIALHPTFEQLKDTLTKAKRDSMKIKRFKTRALDVLEQDPRLDAVRLVIYMDIDIVVGRDLNSFLRQTEKTYGLGDMKSEHHSESKLYLFEDRNMPLHGGVMVMERNNSELCLEHWRNEQDTNPRQAFDQVALLHMYNQNQKQKGEDARCKVVQMQRGKHLAFPTEGYMTGKLKKSNPSFQTFVHVTNNQRAGKISAGVQTEFFVKVLELTEQERSGISSLLGNMIKGSA